VSPFPKTSGEGGSAGGSIAVVMVFFSVSTSGFLRVTAWISLFPETFEWLPGIGKSGNGGRMAKDWVSIRVSSVSEAATPHECRNNASAKGVNLEIMVTISKSQTHLYDITFYKT
jgi:hypothetical protein